MILDIFDRLRARTFQLLQLVAGFRHVEISGGELSMIFDKSPCG